MGQAGLIRLSARGIASFWLTSRKMTRFARGSRFSPSVPNPRIQNSVPRAAVPITSALVGDPVSAGTDKRADKHRYDALYALHSRSLQPQLQLIHSVHRYLPHSAWIVQRPWTLPTAVSCVHVQLQVWPNADPDWTPRHARWGHQEYRYLSRYKPCISVNARCCTDCMYIQ